MANDQSPVVPANFVQIPSEGELRELISRAAAGDVADGLLLLQAPADGPLVLDGLANDQTALVIDGQLVLLMEDGRLLVISGLDGRDYAIQPVEDDAAREQISFFPPETPPSSVQQLGNPGSSGEQTISDVDPLIGLPISPLLPPTDYPPDPERQLDYGAAEGAESQFDLIQVRPAIARETDAQVELLITDYVAFRVNDLAGEVITGVTVEIPGLPAGTTASFGTLTPASDGTLTLVFDGTLAEFEALRVTFPTDFSTENRSDIASGPLQATISAKSSFGASGTVTLPIRLLVEGDITLDGPGALFLTETDSDIDFRPADALLPRATDLDGSEQVTSVTLSFTALPAGSQVSLDGGVSFFAVPANYSFTGSLADYAALVVRLPADYSTINPASSLTAQLVAETNENARIEGEIDITVYFELDVTLTAPDELTAAEDGDGVDGGGVTVDLQIYVAATDADGSEDSTQVEIRFIGLPDGTTANTGTLDSATGSWTGTMAQANALSLTFPGDFSGIVTANIAALSPEGSTSTTQRITITPTGDIDLSASELLAAETDAPVTVTPSDAWIVSLSDFDPNLPREAIDSVTLTLAGLPAGVAVAGVPAGTVVYDFSAGGSLTFTGTLAQYQALQLTFPTDYSTMSPMQPGGVLTGTLAATSTEDATGTTIPVSLRITPEGDVTIDDTLPDTVPDETDDPTQIFASSLLAPQVTDADGSESFTQIVLVVEGLPQDTIFPTIADVQTDAVAQADGTFTVTYTVDPAAADMLAAYNAINFTLQRDFSTTNRSDLLNGTTALPLTFRLSVQTDEDQDLTSDTATDGQQIAERVVDIQATEDITLLAPRLLVAEEDDGVVNSDQGVTVDLGLIIAIGDIDDSETADPGEPLFAATVDISFAGLPAGTTANTGTLDAANGLWSGTVAEANALALTLPGDYNGVILSRITVTTPEGSETRPQAIVVTPTPDIVIDGSIVTDETDAPVPVLLSDAISVFVTDPNEPVLSLTFTLDGLPDGMAAQDGSGAPVGSFTPDGTGTFTFNLTLDSTSGIDPRDVVLIFPTDYSTQTPPTTLVADLSVTTTDGTQTGQIPIEIHHEGDISVDDGTLALAETDAPVVFRPADSVLPAATDQDGSEVVELVSVIFNALPPGSRFSTDNGAVFQPASTSLNFIGTLAEYQSLLIELPTDFSTANPATTLFAEIDAITNEGGHGNAILKVTLDFELDVTLTAPDALTAVEDGDGVDGGGVTVDLQIFVAATDADGSEDSTQVEIRFIGLPDGTTANTGTLDSATGSWTGTMAQANALSLTFPGDFSGIVTANIAALSPEGSTSTTQRITITPTGDIDLSASELLAAETDAPVTVTPSDAWIVSLSDFDPNLPREAIDSVTLTLAGLPAGVAVAGVPAGTVVYDISAGGSLTFTGTLAQYQALQLTFPTDYSTMSPMQPGGVLTGTLAATSTEDATGTSIPVSLRITPEGDVTIDDTLPDTVPDETDDPTQIFASSLLAPQVTDADGSESFTQIILVVEGLPQDTIFPTIADVQTDAVAQADGTFTVTYTVDPAAADMLAAYNAINFTLQRDFSTTNRSDLLNGTTALPLTFRLSVQTDEDQDLTSDTATDGQQIAERVVDINDTEDITLTAPANLTAQEDGGVANSGAGVSVDLQIEISVDDRDNSESADPASPFATNVTILFAGLPANTVASEGVLTGPVWRGSVQEARDLALQLPGDYAGTINSLIIVRSPEGFEAARQTITVTPTPDVEITGAVVTEETDAPLTVLISDYVTIIDTDPSETITAATFTVTGLPAGTTTNATAATLTPDGTGTFTLTYSYPADGTAPKDLTITFPKDFSTENPATTVSGNIELTISDGTFTYMESATVPFTIAAEGDVSVNDGSLALAETDAPVLFRPSDTITPQATDIDGSESITSIVVAIPGAPSGLRYAVDGVTFSDFPPRGFISMSEAEFATLRFELPTDFSTENPTSDLSLYVFAETDERGSDLGVLTVSVAAEGDIVIEGSGSLALDENDAPGDLDEDSTSRAPVVFAPRDALQARATDADGSENVASFDVTVEGLPDGSAYSTDGGLTYQTIPSGGVLSLTGITPSAYDGLLIRVPDDFSTINDITGTVTARTDEAILAGETDTGPNDGVASQNFTVSIASEADVRIDVADITVIEDLGSDIPFNIDASVTDIDGSESITGITVTFDGLPTNGPTTLTDGTVLTGPSDTWTGTAADLAALGARSFPEHFSGIIDITVTVTTDEGITTGTSDSFRLNVTPVAEPTIDLSVDTSEAGVTSPATDQFVVKEDGSFLLLIDAQTPDQDGSESLTRILIRHLPAGWLPNGNVDLTLFEQGAADVASAKMSGTTLTINLKSGVTDFDGAVRISPLADDDRDVQTITGRDLQAIVTSVDTATGLPRDTARARDGIDVDVDAVVDTAVQNATGSSVKENTKGALTVDLDLDGLGLTDNDGSETFTDVELSFTIETASDVFDPATDMVIFVDPGLASDVIITQVAAGADTVTYRFEPAPGATTQQFADALASLEMLFPQHFSGVVSIEGTAEWTETRTPTLFPGDVEIDTSDNMASGSTTIVHTITPVAEAELTASVFVLSTDETADDITRVEASVRNGTITGTEILTLLESTDDGSTTVGQVNLFVGIQGSTPDTDGSEELSRITIENIPTDWIADNVTGGTVNPAAFFTLDGSGPLDGATLAKIDTATYDDTTGLLTITLVPDVTSFEAALQLQPTLYEDYDVDRQAGDPFTALGDYFAADLNISVRTTDTNTATTKNRTASAELDVDVDPVNNIVVLIGVPTGLESVIDAAGGVASVSLTPVIRDMDGSEKITALVLREVPDIITIYVTDLDNPTGPKIPALIAELGVPPGFNTWSLEAGQWDDFEARGIPTHFAGIAAQNVDAVTTEDDGDTRITSLNERLIIFPVPDGGDPSETLNTQEDTAVQVIIDGNIIDNATNSPGSPEDITGEVLIQNVSADSFGRLPRFFEGDPNAGGTELFLTGGELLLSDTQSQNFWVLPGSDSNEQITFNVTVTYFETISPIETTTGTGTVTIDVLGIADAPDVTVQNEDPATTTGGIAQGDVNSIYRPTDTQDGVANYNRAYGYAGYDDTAFRLDMRLTDEALEVGYTSATTVFESAATLAGSASEIVVTPPDGQDGSEVIYYLITGVDPSNTFIGANATDASGETYIVTAANLPNLFFVPGNVSDVTYFDMEFHTIVIENDQIVALPPGNTPLQNLAYIDSLPGGAVVSETFSVVILPESGGGPDACPPEKDLPLPKLNVIGSGDEDTEIALKLQITPVPGFYDSIGDLANLPNGVDGDFTLLIDLPPGAMLSSNPPGAVLLDPATGKYVVDIAKLGVDPTDPTQTDGTLLYTPPEHESSPVNPFDPSETLGPDDPYDNLTDLDFDMVLVNVSCNTTSSGGGSFNIVINPVVDGPDIIFSGGDSFNEDTPYDLDLSIGPIDGGERLVGNVEITIEGDSGEQLLSASGTPISGTTNPDGSTTYSVSPADLAGLSLIPTQHLSGQLTIKVSATSEDIDGSTLTNTASKTVEIIPVADVPIIDFDDTVIDPDTGAPFVDKSGGDAVITIIEDTPFSLSSLITATTPDQDGSEVISITIFDVPDYLELTTPTRTGFVDNGDGSFTLSEASFKRAVFQMKDPHARTPDALDPSLPSSIPLRIGVTTLEIGNSDTNFGEERFSIVVRPDADTPTLTASIAPTTGVEDQPDAYTLTLSATTPDPHETIDFRVAVPVGGTVFLDGTALVPDASGEVLIPGDSGPTFAPTGVVTFVPAGDFAGMVSLDVVAVTSDSTVDGSFTDTQDSAVATLDLDIAVAPDLVLTVDDPDIDLTETDAPVSFDPANGFTIDVTDVDGSETVDSVTYTLTGVPDGTTYSVNGGAPVAAGSDLTFTGSLTQFQGLTVTFPADFATNGTPLSGSLTVTTNEGGNETGTFTVDVDGELDLTTSNSTPISLAQDGQPLQVDFGLIATVTDSQTTPSEWLEKVVVTFTPPLPAGTTASSGSFDASRQTLTLTRGSMDPASFAAAVAALSITLPDSFAGDFSGTITVSTNHGSAPSLDYMVDVNDQPQITGPITFESNDTSFTLDFATLLANASDSDTLTVQNPATTDPDVSVTLLASSVQITVPAGYIGTPVLTYDVVDNAAVPASSQGTADLIINTMQMEDSGQIVNGNPLMTDVTGGTGTGDIALATDAADSVVYDAVDRPYDAVEGFSLMGGDDFIDLSAATAGYGIDGGSGADTIIGSAGADRLTGGTGEDVFTMTSLAATDVITDYEAPALLPGGINDQIDLTALVQLAAGEVLADHVAYDNSTGTLSVDGSQMAQVETVSGFANRIEVIFEDASNSQQTAVI